jgi:hypothetical protein
MEIKTRIGVAVVAAAGLLAFAATSVRGSAADVGDAHERSQVVRAGSPAYGGYLDAVERATIGQRVGSAHLRGQVDAFERDEPLTAPAPRSTPVSVTSGFAWDAAAIGASSVVVLVLLLLGASMILIRRSRDRPLVR